MIDPDDVIRAAEEVTGILDPLIEEAMGEP